MGDASFQIGLDMAWLDLNRLVQILNGPLLLIRLQIGHGSAEIRLGILGPEMNGLVELPKGRVGVVIGNRGGGEFFHPIPDALETDSHGSHSWASEALE